MKPFFSIILPTYNRGALIKRAIESVIQQSFDKWELIIIDDGSSDNTKAIVENFEDNRIRYFYQNNTERSIARNNGIKKARGCFICFLDSDDFFLNKKLENYKHSIDELDDTENVIFYDGLIFQLEETRSKSKLPFQSSNETIYEFLLNHPMGSLQLCIPKKAFEKYLFNPRLRIGEDVELWLRMADIFSFKSVDSYQTVVLQHENRSVSLKKYNSAKEQLLQLNLIFERYDKEQISRLTRKKLKSECYFNSAKHFMMNNNYHKAIVLIFKSLFVHMNNIKNKHKLFCLLNLIRGRVPVEYRSK